MKTKEEILRNKWDEVLIGLNDSLVEQVTLEAMEEYSSLKDKRIEELEKALKGTLNQLDLMRNAFSVELNVSDRQELRIAIANGESALSIGKEKKEPDDCDHYFPCVNNEFKPCEFCGEKPQHNRK